MKKLLTAFLCIASLSLAACALNEKEKVNGTKLTVSQWPENVRSVTIYTDDPSKFAMLWQAGTYQAEEYFTGNARLVVSYNTVGSDERQEWFAFGNTNADENPLKVFINGAEAEDETLPAVRTWTEFNDNQEPEEQSIELNVKSEESFTASFDITDLKEVNVTFENAPRKIKNSEVRLADEQFYAYIDLNELKKNFRTFELRATDVFTGKTRYLPTLTNYGSIYFFDYNGDHELNLAMASKYNYYISGDDLTADFEYAEFVKTYPTEERPDKNYMEFKITLNYIPGRGQVIKITGGEVTAYDTQAFAGKELTFLKALDLENHEDIESASIKIDDGAEKTFEMTMNGTDYFGTWIIKDDDMISLSLDDDSAAFKAGVTDATLTYEEASSANDGNGVYLFQSHCLTDDPERKFACYFYLTESNQGE